VDKNELTVNGCQWKREPKLRNPAQCTQNKRLHYQSVMRKNSKKTTVPAMC